MFKQNTDVFLVNELIGNNATDLIIEGEIYIPETSYNMDKIIYTNGNVKLNNISTLTNKVAVYGDLNYTIIYRSNDENSTTSSANGKIEFMEEIPMQGVTEKMTATITPSIDYIDSKIVSDKKALIKAVVNINTDVTNQHDLSYISNIESDGTFQAKTNNIVYTDISNCIHSEFDISDSIALEPNANEVLTVLKIDVEPRITESDIMNEKMLIEGSCKVSVLYTENNNFCTLNSATKEFPFTNYIDLKNVSENINSDVKIKVNNVQFNMQKDDNDENKLINLDMGLIFTVKMYDTINKDFICDAYSITNELDIENSKIAVSSIVDFKSNKEDFEKTFDVDDVTIKDIYYYDAVAKISEKNIYDDNMTIDGFIDVNVIFLNGDINKVDSVTSSLPFTTSIDLSGYDNVSDVEIDISLNDLGAYRKGINTVLFEAKLLSDIVVKDNKNIDIINNIVLGEKLNHKNMSSIVFRVIQPNETLWDIAKNYNVSMNYICQINNIDINDELVPGNKIIIPKQI